MQGDLISLFEEVDFKPGATDPQPPSEGHRGRGNSTMTDNRSGTLHRDSFFGLAGLMKAKKPYSPSPAPTPKPLLTPTINDVRFASRPTLGNDVPSPVAMSYHTPGSVAVFLEELEQEQRAKDAAPRAPPSPTSRFISQDMQDLGDLMDLMDTRDVSKIENYSHTPLSQEENIALPPSFKLPFSARGVGPFAPPTPGGSICQDSLSSSDNGTGTCSANCKCSALHGELDVMRQSNKDLLSQLSAYEARKQSYETKEHEIEARLGRLQYEIEEDRKQKATMSRALNDKDRALNDKDIEVKRLQRKYDMLTLDQNAVEDQYAKSERTIKSLQEKLADEKVRISELEAQIEELAVQKDPITVDDLKEQLKEKFRECDRQRTQIKNLEHKLSFSEQRTLRASDTVASLRGGAHLVKPSVKAQLPHMVMGCSECYAHNLPCDDHARCRSCVEKDTSCARWRCSLKHVLLNCPDYPACKYPHDANGWLLLREQRPEW